MGTKRSSLRLTDKRKRRIEQCKAIIRDPADDTDDPPMSDVIDAAMKHLIESHENITDARDEYDPETIQDIANTSVLKLHYRTRVESPHRR